MRRFGFILAATVVFLAGAARSEDRPPVRNLIVLLADGAGYNTWLATGHYVGTGHSSFRDAPGWVEVACAVHARRDSRPEDLDPGTPLAELQDPILVYDPEKAWARLPVEGGSEEYPHCFDGYRWLRKAPDSANTASALCTGVATYHGSINVDVFGRPVEPTLVSLARRGGRRTGVVSSVPLSHATPAALGGAHAPSRSLYCSIAREMLLSGQLDVILGCGDGESDKDGRPRAGTDPRVAAYAGGEELWAHLTGRVRLEPGDPVGVAFPAETWEITAEEIRVLDEWRVFRDREAVEALQVGDVPEKLLVVPRVSHTLQADRSSSSDPRWTSPGEDPLLTNVPDLATLTRVALNALDDDPDGFYLCVEGGAIDWAMHDNAAGRMIEETLDFLEAVDAVVEWVERESSWEETLVVVTSDHDHMLWGPRADVVPFDPLADRGPGEVPGHLWLSDHHSNALVRLLARGAFADRLPALARNRDPVRGNYLHQVDAHLVMAAALVPSPEPLPAAIARAFAGSTRVVGVGHRPGNAALDGLVAELAADALSASTEIRLGFLPPDRQADLDAFLDGELEAGALDGERSGLLTRIRSARAAPDGRLPRVRAGDPEVGEQGVVWIASPERVRRLTPVAPPVESPGAGERMAAASPTGYLAVLPWSGDVDGTGPGALRYLAGTPLALVDVTADPRAAGAADFTDRPAAGTELGRMWDAVVRVSP